MWHCSQTSGERPSCFSPPPACHTWQCTARGQRSHSCTCMHTHLEGVTNGRTAARRVPGDTHGGTRGDARKHTEMLLLHASAALLHVLLFRKEKSCRGGTAHLATLMNPAPASPCARRPRGNLAPASPWPFKNPRAVPQPPPSEGHLVLHIRRHAHVLVGRAAPDPSTDEP